MGDDDSSSSDESNTEGTMLVDVRSSPKSRGSLFVMEIELSFCMALIVLIIMIIYYISISYWTRFRDGSPGVRSTGSRRRSPDVSRGIPATTATRAAVEPSPDVPRGVPAAAATTTAAAEPASPDAKILTLEAKLEEAEKKLKMQEDEITSLRLDNGDKATMSDMPNADDHNSGQDTAASSESSFRADDSAVHDAVDIDRKSPTDELVDGGAKIDDLERPAMRLREENETFGRSDREVSIRAKPGAGATSPRRGDASEPNESASLSDGKALDFGAGHATFDDSHSRRDDDGPERGSMKHGDCGIPLGCAASPPSKGCDEDCQSLSSVLLLFENV